MIVLARKLMLCTLSGDESGLILTLSQGGKMNRILFVYLFAIGLILALVFIPVKADDSQQFASLGGAKNIDKVKAFLANTSKNVPLSRDPAEQVKRLTTESNLSVVGNER
jgi:hypothetical protein